MSLPSSTSRADHGPSYPRHFRIAGQWVSSFKACLCVGMCLGILVIVALAQSSGFPPLRVGFGSLALAIVGIAGARAYHLLVYHRLYFGKSARQSVWSSKDGGGSIFGALLAVAPCSFAVAHLLDVPANVFWDFLSAGILAGGFWARLGCAFNGCCGGRETRGWFGVRLHDIRGVRRRRVPVQFLRNGLVAPRQHGVHLALAQILPARKLRAGRAGLVWAGPLFPGTAARSSGSCRRPGAHQSGLCRRTCLGRRHRFAGEGVDIRKSAWWRTQSVSNPSLHRNSLLTGKRTGSISNLSLQRKINYQGEIQGKFDRFPADASMSALKLNVHRRFFGESVHQRTGRAHP